MWVDSASSATPLHLQGKFYSFCGFFDRGKWFSEWSQNMVYTQKNERMARMLAFPMTLLHPGTLPMLPWNAWANVPECELSERGTHHLRRVPAQPAPSWSGRWQPALSSHQQNSSPMQTQITRDQMGSDTGIYFSSWSIRLVCCLAKQPPLPCA